MEKPLPLARAPHAGIRMGIITDSEPESDSDESVDLLKLSASGMRQTNSESASGKPSIIMSSERTFAQQKLHLEIRSLKLKQDVLMAKHMELENQKKLLELRLRELNNVL